MTLQTRFFCDTSQTPPPIALVGQGNKTVVGGRYPRSRASLAAAVAGVDLNGIR